VTATVHVSVPSLPSDASQKALLWRPENITNHVIHRHLKQFLQDKCHSQFSSSRSVLYAYCPLEATRDN